MDGTLDNLIIFLYLIKPSYVSIAADDCCLLSDSFELILDNISAACSYTDFSNSVSGPGLFHDIYTGLLNNAGTHTFSGVATLLFFYIFSKYNM